MNLMLCDVSKYINTGKLLFLLVTIIVVVICLLKIINVVPLSCLKYPFRIGMILNPPLKIQDNF